MTLTLEQLTDLINQYKDLDEACTAARNAGCLDIDGRLQACIWSTVETVINFFDPEGWIMWYILDNDYGAKSMKAGFAGDLKPIKTVEDLFHLMYNKQPDETHTP
jgi:hypothetical protein